MINIAIVEDDKTFLNDLKNFLLEYQKDIKEKINISKFEDGLLFLEKSYMNFDIVFLDIKLPFENGISIAKKFRTINTDTDIILITALEKYAIDGYEIGASAFVLKPYDPKVLKRKLDFIIEKRSRNNSIKIAVKQDSNNISIALKDVVYIESSGHYCYLKTNDGNEYKKQIPLKQLEANYLSQGFAKVNGSTLINIAYLKSWSGKSIILDDDTTFPLGRSFKKSFYIQVASWNGFRE